MLLLMLFYIIFTLLLYAMSTNTRGAFFMLIFHATLFFLRFFRPCHLRRHVFAIHAAEMSLFVAAIFLFFAYFTPLFDAELSLPPSLLLTTLFRDDVLC